MQAIWHYIATLPLWKQIAITAAFFTSLGLTLRDLLSYVVGKIQTWHQHRVDDQVVAYLVKEYELHPPTGPDKAGYRTSPQYRSSIDIAKALRRTAVDIRQRLEKLEAANRIERPGPFADMWTATKYELHDKSRRTVST
jgi:hypothetical protein